MKRLEEKSVQLEEGGATARIEADEVEAILNVVAKGVLVIEDPLVN